MKDYPRWNIADNEKIVFIRKLPGKNVSTVYGPFVCDNERLLNTHGASLRAQFTARNSA